MATDTEPEKFPPLGVIVGVATVNAKVTLRVKAVVFVTPPPVEVTVMGKLPAGVDPMVTMFNTVEHDGLQAVEELRALVPEGMTMAQFALRWILMFDAVTCAIPGAKRPSQVEENVFTGDLSPLSDETMNAVRKLYETRIRPLVHHYW